MKLDLDWGSDEMPGELIVFGKTHHIFGKSILSDDDILRKYTAKGKPTNLVLSHQCQILYSSCKCVL